MGWGRSVFPWRKGQPLGRCRQGWWVWGPVWGYTFCLSLSQALLCHLLPCGVSLPCHFPRDSRPGAGGQNKVPRLGARASKSCWLMQKSHPSPSQFIWDQRRVSSSLKNRSLGFFSLGLLHSVPSCLPAPTGRGTHRGQGDILESRSMGRDSIGGEGKSLCWESPSKGPGVFPGPVDEAFTGDPEPDPRPCRRSSDSQRDRRPQETERPCK